MTARVTWGAAALLALLAGLSLFTGVIGLAPGALLHDPEALGAKRITSGEVLK